MFIAIEQLEASMLRLESLHPFFGTAFLAFKRQQLPVGTTTTIQQTRVCKDMLQEHFRPSERYDGFYSPFASSKGKDARWLRSDYGSSGLQRICTDTFGDAFIHNKGTSQWGWSEGYTQTLKRHLGSDLIPAFDLAVWLYRDECWPAKTTKRDIVNRLFREFFISTEEKQSLVCTKVPAKPNSLRTTPVSKTELLELIGWPPGVMPPGGALLRHLDIRCIGPATHFTYDPAERLNLVTGDNSLGKTFLLELIWWALTDEWCGDYPALPRSLVAKTKPRIAFRVSTGARRTQELTAKYDWLKHTWSISPKKREAVSGLVIYARYDGSFGIWDPVRLQFGKDTGIDHVSQIVLKPHDVWTGLRRTGITQREQTLCNGLKSDWITWQIGGERYARQYQALTSALAELSPPSDVPIVPGDPYRFPMESQECPTLRMSYGDVPIVLASAGIQRAIAMAYVLVWAWHEHVAYAESSRIEPQRRLVLMVDEVEAHLHPRWQRTIVPALMNVVSALSKDVNPQLHIATHSPLVLASAETVFNDQSDSLHHLHLADNNVVLEEVPFVKYGRVDRWLMSDIFGLDDARSVPAEAAIEDAKTLQLARKPKTTLVRDVHKRLIQHLADDDEFWPRWLYFAEQHGVEV